MLPYPASLSVPFGRDAVAPYIRVVPIPSQTGIQPGAASWATGFVPLNMTLKTAGGIAPFGEDMNGVLNYITQNLVWLCAGGGFVFNADFVTNWGGYPIGAVLRSVSNAATCFYNTTANNANNPDVDPTGWASFSLLSTPINLQTNTPAAGTFNNVAVGSNIGFLDVNTAAGDVIFTGMTAGRDGQIVVVSNTGPNLLTLNGNDAGSTAANRYRQATNLSYTQYDGRAYRYSVQCGFWIPM